MKKTVVVMAVLALVLGAAGYTLAQMGGQGGMMGQGGGMMGPGMMGQGGMMTGQPLTQEQLQQFAERHKISLEQAKQMTDSCLQIMGGTPEGQKTQ